MDLPQLKKEMADLLDGLPDDADWDDVMYSIYVRQSIEDGLVDSKKGNVVDHSVIREKFLE
ncbi:hypothetical protein [Rhodohalobacter sp.]|uniref:hypothetical protein n=1 Tax=Rhodohalobacter sp. TaxID=1974210 RepID=UPI002ACD76CD|nr:hypothetical protein [Rhodohalobacter sp.]MDZ7756598.1 hypothetical protein [Rhodohalobacter sp.]